MQVLDAFTFAVRSILPLNFFLVLMISKFTFAQSMSSILLKAVSSVR